jgi:hypothetical protein
MFVKNMASIFIFIFLCFSQNVSAKSKTHVKTGLLIGSLSGAAVGLGTSFTVAQKFKCNEDQRAEGEPCALYTIVPIAGTVGGAALGIGLGALIGSLIPKKQNISIAPVITHDEKSGTFGGLALNKAF